MAVASSARGGDCHPSSMLRPTASNDMLTTDIVRAQDDHRNGNVVYEAAAASAASNGCPLETMM